MDRELARLVASSAIRAGSELGNLVALVNEHGADESLKHGIATAIAEISFSILQPVFREHPDLEDEFDARIGKYGRAS